MQIDLELYRQEIRLSTQPVVRLSAIDIAPEGYYHTLVFLHGYGGRARQWQYQLEAFSNNNRVIALDMRGHGLSDKPHGRYSMAVLLSDLENALQALEIHQPITLIGHSFGGAIACEFAAAHPEQVSQLVLIATAGEFRLNPLYRFLLRLPYTLLQLAAPLVRGWLGAPPNVMKAFYQDTLLSWNGWSLFRDLRLPTLVIHGHMDRVFEKPAFEEVTRAIPQAEEVDVGASGHMVMLERREAVNRAIRRFLEAGWQSWREAGDTTQPPGETGLLEERPWLRYYDEGVPHSIAVPNIPVHHLLRSAVRRFPLRTALQFKGNRISYHRLNRESNRFANALRSLGLEKGERVMLLLPNLPQMVIAYFGTLKAGGVAVFSLSVTDPDELLRQVKDCAAKFLVAIAQPNDLIPKIKAQLDSGEPLTLKHILLTHPGAYLPPVKRTLLEFSPEWRKRHAVDALPGVETHAFTNLLYRHSPGSPDLDAAPGDLAAIIYTGGTTALPKGVMLSHRNLVANTLQTRHWIPEAREGKERFLCALPFGHIYGLTITLNVPVAIAATLILLPRFEAAHVLKTIKRHHPTIFPGVPQMYRAIKDFPGVRKYGIASIKACISGSAPLPVEVQEAFEKLTRGRLVEGYGLTEASPVTHANPLQGVRKVGSIGIPFPSTEARLVDLKTGKKAIPISQIGELAVRGPQVMLGYWADPHLTRRVLSPDGWLHTGDVAQMDQDGYFRIIARKADMWYPSRPGKPAFPRDVEEVLYEIPQVKETAVIAIAGQPIAFVISQPVRPTVESLMAYCKRRLPPTLVPRLVIFVDDFPRTFIGKVIRRELARRFEQSQTERQGDIKPSSDESLLL
jgi:long-chain acyl-CoA synthetase